MSTIAAIATPPGKGAIAIVRVSGPHVRSCARRLVKAKLQPRRMTTADILDENGALVDRGVAVLAPAPHSYTGEDLLELHVHGSPVVAREVLRAILACGARLAAPGEFTRRAFLNGKMPLSAASAVADLIGAETRAAAQAAVANLAGGLSTQALAIAAVLRATLEELAGAVDFPDEVPDPPRDGLVERLRGADDALQELASTAEVGRLVREGVSVAIVGPSNAGKSSLLNALLGEERVLVSDLPGTTRDTIEEAIVVEGVAVRLIDTAGVRGHADRLEAAGIDRSFRAIDRARIALVVIDGSQPLDDLACDVLDRTALRERIVFYNKADLGSVAGQAPQSPHAIVGSVYDAATLEALRREIARVGWGGERFDFSRPYLATAAELDAVIAARESLRGALETLDGGEPCDLIVRDVTDALASLEKITSEAATEDVLDGIFARFCIGK
jgi:tRNA modification GTPase